MTNDNDPSLEVLIVTKDSLDIDLEDDFLKRCFEIQKKYQYRGRTDRILPIKEMNELINEYIDKFTDKERSDSEAY